MFGLEFSYKYVLYIIQYLILYYNNYYKYYYSTTTPTVTTITTSYYCTTTTANANATLALITATRRVNSPATITNL